MDVNKQEKDSRNPIFSLVSMLDDPDPVVYEKISDSILNLGSGAIPVLQEVAENSFDPLVLERLNELICNLHSEGIINDLQRWKNSENQDLIQLLQILSKFHQPELDMVKFNERITAMQKEIWLELNENLTSLECVRLVNHFFYKTWGFISENANNHEPDLFFLNKSLEGKKTHPATLGAFYLGMCQRLTLPVFYVGLPENFILAYTSQPLYKPDFKPGTILFYLNPLLNGVIFNKTEIDVFLKNHNIASRPEYYEASGNIQVAILMLNEMRNVYESKNAHEKIGYIQKMIAVMQGSISEDTDLF
mgnify:CR=1 FL=1